MIVQGHDDRNPPLLRGPDDPDRQVDQVLDVEDVGLELVEHLDEATGRGLGLVALLEAAIVVIVDDLVGRDVAMSAATQGEGRRLGRDDAVEQTDAVLLGEPTGEVVRVHLDAGDVVGQKIVQYLEYTH